MGTPWGPMGWGKGNGDLWGPRGDPMRTPQDRVGTHGDPMETLPKPCPNLALPHPPGSRLRVMVEWTRTIAATRFNCVNGDNGNTDVFRTPTSNFLQNQCKRGQLTRCEAFFQHIPASKQVLRTPHYVLPNPFT